MHQLRTRIAAIALAVCPAILLCSPAQAQTTATWTSGNSSVAGNWSTGSVPGVDDSVIASAGSAVLTLNSTLDIKAWTWGGNSNGSLTITNGGSLTIDGGTGTTESAHAKSIFVTQTDPDATLISAASFGGRNLTVRSDSSAGTAYFTIPSGLHLFATHGLTPNGNVNVADTVDRNGQLTVAGTLTASSLNLGAATGSGSATFVIDGGLASIRASIVRAAGGDASFLFKSGTLRRENNAVQIRSDGVSPLDIALGATGSRVVDTNNGLISMLPTARFVDETTAGSLRKEGLGDLVLQGANTHTGDTVIAAGSIRIEQAAEQVLAGTLGGSGNRVLSGLASTQGLFIGQPVAGEGIAANSIIAAISATSVTLDRNQTTGGVTATFAAANGTLEGTTLDYDGQGGTLSFGQSTAVLLGGLKGSQNLALVNAASAAVALSVGGNGSSTTYGGVLSGAGSLVKQGSGTLTLSGANTFDGTLTVAGGTLAIATINDAGVAGPLGAGSAPVLLGDSGSTGTLSYTGPTAASTRPFQAVAGGTAAFLVTDAATTLTLSGLIDGDGDKLFGGVGNTVIAGGFGGSGTVTKTGAGSLTLTQAGHAGGYDIQAGRLNLNAASAIGNATALALGTGIELDNSSAGAVTINNGTVAISLGSSLDFLGTQDLNLGVGTVTLGSATAIDVAAGTLTLAGNVVDGGGGFGLTKRGAGTLVLSGLTTGAFSGDTTIAGGTLKLGSGGSLANSPRIIVGSAGSTGAVLDLSEKTAFAIGGSQTLEGTGIVRLGGSTNLTVAGLLSPGSSPGLLTFDGGGTTTLAGTTLMEIQGPSRGVLGGYDAIDISGSTTLSLGGILELDFAQTFADGTTFSLFTPDFSSSLTNTFASITMVGSAYSDLTFTGNAGFWTTNVGGANQSMTFNSSTGELAILVVPEPASLALLAVAAAAGLPLLRRRLTPRLTARLP
jgi:fibronectin-binding autotransporter adhesin